ncbi:hypothetical protein GCM10010307_61190 [Streptomyces vastus]|uniref:Uncharacterized protein n=1 Tax=Streptomyces vastus TaxID=285451 RepID=A0ABN3RFF6_9ACTN
MRWGRGRRLGGGSAPGAHTRPTLGPGPQSLAGGLVCPRTPARVVPPDPARVVPPDPRQGLCPDPAKRRAPLLLGAAPLTPLGAAPLTPLGAAPLNPFRGPTPGPRLLNRRSG